MKYFPVLFVLAIFSMLSMASTGYGRCTSKIRVLTGASSSRGAPLFQTLQKELSSCDLQNIDTQDSLATTTAMRSADIIYIGQFYESTSSAKSYAELIASETTTALERGATVVKVGDYHPGSNEQYFSSLLNLGMTRKEFHSGESLTIIEPTHPLLEGVTSLSGISYVTHYKFPQGWTSLVSQSGNDHLGIKSSGKGTFIVMAYSFYKIQSSAKNWERILFNTAKTKHNCFPTIVFNSANPLELNSGAISSIDFSINNLCDNSYDLQMRSWYANPSGNHFKISPAAINVSIPQTTNVTSSFEIDTAGFKSGEYQVGASFNELLTGKSIAKFSKKLIIK